VAFYDVALVQIKARSENVIDVRRRAVEMLRQLVSLYVHASLVFAEQILDELLDRIAQQ
jgi:hypothetical protein